MTSHPTFLYPLLESFEHLLYFSSFFHLVRHSIRRSVVISSSTWPPRWNHWNHWKRAQSWSSRRQWGCGNMCNLWHCESSIWQWSKAVASFQILFSDLFHDVFIILRCCLSTSFLWFWLPNLPGHCSCNKVFCRVVEQDHCRDSVPNWGQRYAPLRPRNLWMHLQDLAMPACQIMSAVFGNRCGKNTVWESE